MRGLCTVIIFSVALLVFPLVPNVEMKQTPGGTTVEISPGGQAMGWNLIAELCGMGWDDMCDLYFHGVSEGWWEL